MSSFGRKQGRDVQTFGMKISNGHRTMFQKLGNSHIARKFNNTMSQINRYADPILIGSSLVAPEFAPIFEGIRNGLKGTEMVSKGLRYAESNYENKKKKPRLER